MKFSRVISSPSEARRALFFKQYQREEQRWQQIARQVSDQCQLRRHREIGAALGVPAGTVRYRLSLARRALADAVGDYDDPQEEQ